MEPITITELKDKLKKERTVQACGMTFRIRKVPLLLLSEQSDDLWELARQGQDVLAQKIKTLVSSPTLPRLRRVLLSGIVQPKVSSLEEEDAVCIDLLLSDYQLSSSLFVEIINFSLET